MSSTDRSPELPEHPADEAPAAADPAAETATPPAAAPVVASAEPAGGRPFIGGRRRPRPRAESVLVRLVSTAGIVGVSVAIAAILGTQDVAAWIIGLVVSVLSVVLAAVLWSSRTL